MLELAHGDYRLALEPQRGGCVMRFDWRDQEVMRPTCGPSMLDTAAFALMPFSNRIANGRFSLDGRTVVLRPNFPGSDHPHTLHGFSWLAPWEVVDCTPDTARFEHLYPGGEWPWRYRAEQHFVLDDEGLLVRLRLTNLSTERMPAGIGFHPYFHRDADTIYHGLHRGEWQVSDDGLPVSLRDAGGAADWWLGQPVGARMVDTVYTGREGPLSLIWPSRDMMLSIIPSPELDFTVIFTPGDAPFLCVEPVSHMTDAVNRRESAAGLAFLDRDESLTASIRFAAAPANAEPTIIPKDVRR